MPNESINQTVDFDADIQQNNATISKDNSAVSAYLLKENLK